MHELDHKDGWALRNSCFWTVVLEKTLECLLDCKEIKPVNSKGNQPWIFIRRIDAEAEAPILWPPHGKSLLFGKDPDAGKDWRQEEQGWQRTRWLNGITDSVNMLLLFTQLSLSLCDPMDCSMPGFPVLHHLPKFAQTRVHWVSDAIQPSHSPLSPSPAFTFPLNQVLFHWVNSSYQVAKVLEFQLLWEMVKYREIWLTVVHGVAKSWTRLSNWTTVGQLSCPL